ncbi:MAG: hypothetical protein OEV86_12975 [Candidatus Krumholzibacteria bacterium]|nr:hypothetical protein [Candidatus Krumholzibacteria bacterium]
MRTRLYQRISGGHEDISDTERGFLGALNEDLQEMDSRINRALKYKTRIVATRVVQTGTEIRHNLGRVPRHVSVAPKSDVRWWEYKPRTRDSIFLKTSADADLEVRIEG